MPILGRKHNIYTDTRMCMYKALKVMYGFHRIRKKNTLEFQTCDNIATV